jgi:hypothetical protein
MLPGIVISIGGTGKWVNTHIKKRLGGSIPPELRLLCFDTVQRAEITPVTLSHFDPQQGTSTQIELNFGAGDTPEFYDFSEFWARTIDDIKQGHGDKYPLINEWLGSDAQAYNLASSQKSTKDGGGQLRQATRVSLSLKANEVYQRVRDALRAMAGKGTGQSRIQVFIIGSLAGGTGCGTFLDLAFFVHQAVTEIGEAALPILPVGIFLLPSGFEGVHPNDRERKLQPANCFAAFREMHRFNFVQSAVFRHQSGVTAALGNKRPFDLCYFIDGTSVAGQSGSEVPHYNGTCPAIADFVLLSLGDQTSNVSVAKNLTTPMMGALTAAESSPMEAAFYSTFGIHEYLLDTDSLRRAFGLKIEADLLRHIVEGPFAGDVLKECHTDFIKAGTLPGSSGKMIVNSGFNRVLVTGLLENDTGSLECEFLKGCFLFPDEPDTMPIADLSGIDRGGFLHGVSFERVRDEADAEANRVFQLFSANLKSLADRQRAVLTDGLQGWLVNRVLNAADRRGSLAHAEAFLRLLKGRYDEADRKLKERHGALKLSTRVTESEKRLAGYLERRRKDEYVDELETKTRLKQQDDLANRAIELAGFAIDAVEKCVTAIQSWAAILTAGRTLAEQSERTLAGIRSDERNVMVRTYVSQPGDALERKLYGFITGTVNADPHQPIETQVYDRLPHVDLNAVAGKFTWEYRGGTLACELDAAFSPMDVFRSNWKLWNHNFIGNYIERDVLKSLDDLAAADVLALAGVTGGTLAAELQKKAGELAAYDATAQLATSGNAAVSADTAHWLYYYVDATAPDPGKSVLDAAKAVLGPAGYSAVPGFTDRRRIVIWRTQHFIKPAGFVNLANTEKAYRAGVVKNDPAPLHVLAGERVAAAIEDAFQSVLHEDPHCLHPRVVNLLDNTEALKPFLYALDFPGMLPITVKVVGGEEKYVFKPATGREVELGPKSDPVAAAARLLGQKPDLVQARKELAVAFDTFLNSKLVGKAAFVQELENASNAISVDAIARDAQSDLQRVRKVILKREAERFA